MSTMPAALTQRWTVDQATPLGDVSTSWELAPEGLHLRSDAPMGAESETLRWDAIAEAATAVVELPAQKGGPDMVRWMPGRMEWLLISRSDGGRSFMRALPGSDERDAIVAALRERLGSRWAGEGLPLQSAQTRFRISARGDGLKFAPIIGSAFALLIVLVLVVGIVGSVLYLPALLAVGAWLFHKGLAGLRDALHIANTPSARVPSAAMGLVELEGRAIAEQPTPAGVSGRPSVWWDVGVDAWYSRGPRKSGRWRQVMARHGGNGALMLEDATGRVPVWLRDADLVLQVHTWESGKDALPPPGVALLEGTAFAWNGGSRLRVRERRMEAGKPVYVLGTLDEARHLSAEGEEHGLPRLVRTLRTGAWRIAVVRKTPELLRPPVMVAIGCVDLLSSVGHGGGRAHRLQDALPPALAPDAQRLAAEEELSRGIGRLLVTAEAYPELKASASYLDLQRRISGLEEQIAHRREYYNAAVNLNNVRMEQFPYVLLVGLAGLARRPLFAAASEERADLNVGALLAR